MIVYLDTSTTTFAHGIRYSGSGRVNHGHKTHKSETSDWEVDIFGVEVETFREIFRVQIFVTKPFRGGTQLDCGTVDRLGRLVTKDTFTTTTEVHISGLKVLFPFISHRFDLSLIHNLCTSVQNPFWGTFHDQ